MNQYANYYPSSHNSGDRFFFLPFLGGALLGGAAVAVSRPRPVFVQGGPMYAPYPTPYPAPGPYYGGGYNYGNAGYYNYR